MKDSITALKGAITCVYNRAYVSAVTAAAPTVQVVKGALLFLCDLTSIKFWNEKNILEGLALLYNLVAFVAPFFIFVGTSIGVVLTVQMNYSLSDLHAESQIPKFVAVSLLRGFGPVVSAIVYAGVVSASIVSEISLMKATDQLLSMELMGVKPLVFVFIPRFLATILALPVLMLLFIGSGLVGSRFFYVYVMGQESSFFTHSLISSIMWRSELRRCMLKSLSFSVFIAWISIYAAKSGPSDTIGISRTTVKSIIASYVAVIFLNVLLDLYFFST